MQFKVILISGLLATFNLVKTSSIESENYEKEIGSFDGLSSETDSENVLTTSSCGMKRNAGSILSTLEPDYDSSSRKESRPTSIPKKRVHFDQTELYNDVYDIKNPDAELKYLEALYRRDFSVTFEMRRQGLMLSCSNLCFEYVNSLLRSEHDCRDILIYLLKNQPNVFYQYYDCNQNVFYGATQSNMDFILHRTLHIPRVHVMIFTEVLRNPDLRLGDDFFISARADRACAMIDLAESFDRPDMILKSYLLPRSLLYHDLDGETFFTKAVLERNIRRIKFLNMRSDAVEFMLTENLKSDTSGKNCIDLAIEIYDKNLDPNYSVMLTLFPAISTAFIYGETGKVEELIEEFIDNIIEADDNEVLLNGLERALYSAKELINRDEQAVEEGQEQETNLMHQVFDDFLTRKLVEIYDFRLKNQGSEDDSSENTTDRGSDSSSFSKCGNESDIDSIRAAEE